MSTLVRCENPEFYVKNKITNPNVTVTTAVDSATGTGSGSWFEDLRCRPYRWSWFRARASRPTQSWSRFVIMPSVQLRFHLGCRDSERRRSADFPDLGGRKYRLFGVHPATIVRFSPHLGPVFEDDSWTREMIGGDWSLTEHTRHDRGMERRYRTISLLFKRVPDYYFIIIGMGSQSQGRQCLSKLDKLRSFLVAPVRLRHRIQLRNWNRSVRLWTQWIRQTNNRHRLSWAIQIVLLSHFRSHTLNSF